MANERITEGIVRDHFKNNALFKSIKWEEQRSSNKRISELLKGESKGNGKGNGFPEFIISFPTNSNYIIVVECKANVSDHESKKRDNAVKFAVDGVIHYAKALSKEFNVIAIAVSGQTENELLVSDFYWKREEKGYKELNDKELLDIDDYLQVFEDQFFIQDFYTRDIAYKAQYLNKEFQNYTIPEYKRCTMISAMLLALINQDFQDNYETEKTIKDLGESLLSAINSVFEAEKDIVRSKTVLLREFENILNEPLFVQETIKHKKNKQESSTLEVAKDIIRYLQIYVYPLIKHSNIGYDVLGRFYIEFIRYAGSEQKSGLVLTPAHITELFCDLAELKLSDIVYDPCCGTGGFLVAAMQRLFKMAGNSTKKREHIREKQICGCELRSDMFSYACSSMRFRGDGKSNIYNGSCFNNGKSILNNHKPTVAFLNPPYDVGNAQQMEFVEHALNVLNPQANGRVVAIVQMSCAIKNEKELFAVKKRLLTKHHLKAVLSMPDDLFYPIGVVTCIMVFEANKTNAGHKTWFGYFKDDGFEKRKNLGRIDARNRYTTIKERWLSAYRNFDEIPGLSVRKEVGYKDEWCAEAYMETDYSTLCDEDFIRKMRNYVSFLVKCSMPNELFYFSNQPLSNNRLQLNTKFWKWFKLQELFYYERGVRLTQPDRQRGNIPLVTAGEADEGVADYISNEEMIRYNDRITIDMFGNCFYREYVFCCDDNILVLQAKNNELSKYQSIFIATIINKDIYKCAYGRQYRQKTFVQHKIKLPETKDGTPDWKFMEDYIKGLPYSSCL